MNNGTAKKTDDVTSWRHILSTIL